MINGLQDLMYFAKRAYLAGCTQWFILEVRKYKRYRQHYKKHDSGDIRSLGI